MNEVVALVLNYNQAEATRRCVASLLRGTRVPDKVIVVDNGSDEHPGLSADEWSSGVELLRADANSGYAGGNNLGIRAALKVGAQFIWVLNNDTIVDPRCLETLMREVNVGTDSEVYLTAVRDAGAESWWYRGGWVDARTGTVWHTPRHRVDADVVETEYIAGCSLLVPSSVFKRVGGFDESLFLYCEDVDWSLRAIGNGVRALLVPNAIVDHIGGGSSRSGRKAQGARFYYNARNRLWLARRGAYQLGPALVATPRWLVRELRSARRHNSPPPTFIIVRSLMRGIADGLRPRIPGAKPADFGSDSADKTAR